jgi:anti-anti-sigma regulatory factor
MLMKSMLLKVDEQHVVELLKEALTRLGDPGEEIVLDFSDVACLDSAALRELDHLAVAAGDLAVNVALRGLSVEVYKVLELMKLTAQFSIVH